MKNDTTKHCRFCDKEYSVKAEIHGGYCSFKCSKADAADYEATESSKWNSLREV